MQLIKPSDSQPPSLADISRVKSLMGQLSPHLQRPEHGPLSKPDGVWEKKQQVAHYVVSKRLMQCAPAALRFFRLFCQNFSGFSVYHNKNPWGTSPPGTDSIGEVEADLYWQNATFPTDIYGEHLRLTHGVPHGLIYQPPLRCGEAGWMVNGRLISVDQVYYQRRLSVLYFSGLARYLESKLVERGEIRILEIGGGYGALAFALKQYFPQAHYTIVDLPESLVFSSAYLTLTRPDLPISIGLPRVPFGFRLVPAQMAAQVTEEFDLVINTLSMAEMSVPQVEEYARLIRDIWLAKSGFFFEQNCDNRNVGLNFPELILQNFLEKKVTVNWPQSNLLEHGTPLIWQKADANPGIAFNADVLTPPSVKLMNAGAYSLAQCGDEYVLSMRGCEIGRSPSVGELISWIGQQLQSPLREAG